MRNLFTLVILAAVSCAAYFVYNSSTQEQFLLRGRVEVVPEMLKQAQAINNTCSIIVKNEADVPVAIKRVINPQFPMEFTITKADLLVGELIGDVKLEVQINDHGNLGVLKAGDIFGNAAGMFEPNTKDIVVMANQRTGMPKFADRSRGNFFRTAAR